MGDRSLPGPSECACNVGRGWAMSANQSANQAIPFLRSDEAQIGKVRRQLEAMFRELRLVQDVIIVCGGVSASVGSEFDDEVEHVLRRCASDRMHTVLKTLTNIVERFGGKTDLSDEREDETRPQPEATQVSTHSPGASHHRDADIEPGAPK
jgi:hypothetical protein